VLPRKVSNDNVVSYNVDYEVPRGHAGTDIAVGRHLLSGALSIAHDGRLVVQSLSASGRTSAIAKLPKASEKHC